MPYLLYTKDKSERDAHYKSACCFDTMNYADQRSELFSFCTESINILDVVFHVNEEIVLKNDGADCL